MSKKSLVVALIIGGVSGYQMDNFIEKHNVEKARYPLESEYNIIENCLSNYNKPLARNIFLNKKSICFCALEKTELEYAYTHYKSDQDTFLAIFEKKATECMPKK